MAFHTGSNNPFNLLAVVYSLVATKLGWLPSSLESITINLDIVATYLINGTLFLMVTTLFNAVIKKRLTNLFQRLERVLIRYVGGFFKWFFGLLFWVSVFIITKVIHLGKFLFAKAKQGWRFIKKIITSLNGRRDLLDWVLKWALIWAMFLTILWAKSWIEGGYILGGAVVCIVDFVVFQPIRRRW